MRISDGLYRSEESRSVPECGKRVCWFLRCDFTREHNGPHRFYRAVRTKRWTVRVNWEPTP